MKFDGFAQTHFCLHHFRTVYNADKLIGSFKLSLLESELLSTEAKARSLTKARGRVSEGSSLFDPPISQLLAKHDFLKSWGGSQL